MLTPAFDIVAWVAYLSGQGNALAIYRDTSSPRTQHGRVKVNTLTALSLREFCNRVGVVEKPCAAVIKDTVTKAIETWPALVDAGFILPEQKEKLMKRFNAHPFVQQQVLRKFAKI